MEVIILDIGIGCCMATMLLTVLGAVSLMTLLFVSDLTQRYER